MAEDDRCWAPADSFSSDEFECKICYNYFDLDRRTPKLLACSHSFCRECLDALHRRDGRGWRIGCPVCRHRTPVPEYRVCNLPDDTRLTEVLPLKKHELDQADLSCTRRDEHTGPTVSRAGESWETCEQVAFASGCACAVFSVVSTMVLMFLGLVFVHNFNNMDWPVGPLCLFVASVLALFSIILTWLMCLLKYRPETEANSSLTSNAM